MTRERIPMRTIKEVLRLKWSCGQSRRAIAKSCGVARSTVDEYAKRANQAGLSWPLPAELDDAALELLLYPPVLALDSPRPLPVWADIHRELARKSVTLTLLWDEYKAQYPEGYQYSHFADLYRAYAKKLDISMRQVHLAGEKLFVDYCGQTSRSLTVPPAKYTTDRSSWPFWAPATTPMPKQHIPRDFRTGSDPMSVPLSLSAA